jgi:hypothetical protein
LSQVISFNSYKPAARYDAVPWTQAQIEEGDTVIGPWAIIDTVALSPVDPDPSLPAFRSFSTSLASDTPDLWYRVTFLDAAAATSQPTLPVQNSVTLPEVAAYSDTAELARILHLKSPSAAQEVAMQRVLDTAALEIDSELGRVTPYPVPPALVVEVNLERAVEHWQQQESPFGIVALGFGESSTATYTARDSWDRHAHKLVPLKTKWGIA